MTMGPDAALTDTQQQLERSISAVEDERYRANTQTFTATDEAATVEVVVNGHGWLTGLYIEPGLLRLGVEMVRQRILQALYTAQAAASEAGEVAAEQLHQTLAAALDKLDQTVGDLAT
ncbi:YbaB/EbfC family nucleoid-associated protein [Mycobacterium sp. 050272]|uniref:YbaB/EbfC family nucleoid-associated protein n=1 Tax=Mycobacterium sp. 050272 TaxID=3142488 RepID=UPI00319D57AD